MRPAELHSLSAEENCLPANVASLRSVKEMCIRDSSYTNDKEAKQTFKHTFKNERVTAKISLQKQDKETKKAVDRKSTRLNSSHSGESRMPSSA